MTVAKKLLVVDDEPNLCFLYETCLQDEGYVVKTATSAIQALKDEETFKPDLVIMDIRMPGMDGIEAMGIMLNQKRDLRIILHSAYSSYKNNFCTWPASAYVIKSSDLSELIRTIHDLLDRTMEPNTHGRAA